MHWSRLRMFAPPSRRPGPATPPPGANARVSGGERSAQGSTASLNGTMGEKGDESLQQSAASLPLDTQRSERGAMTVHEANRAKKAVERNRKAIENRIRFFQKEEEKIWRDLEEVRRQAATIEEGRSRTIEKKLADRAIQQEKELSMQQNRSRASQNKAAVTDIRKRQQFEAMRERQLLAQEQRETSQAIMRQKRITDIEERRINSERAAMIQIQQKDARSRASQERAMRLEAMRQHQEYERQQAEQEVLEAETVLPDLEEQEMICLQRLQNSRIVTQSVLEELENRLGSRSSVTSLLRSKQRGQDHLESSVGGFSPGAFPQAEEQSPGADFAGNGLEQGDAPGQELAEPGP